MEKLAFEIQISAPASLVWESLWQDANYRAWTAVFHEGSYAESDWQEGSKIYFLSPGGNGMYSIISQKVENEYMQFTHHGEILQGQEQPPGVWAGATEAYRLQQNESGTLLNVTLDADASWVEYFSGIFPKALEKVKELAERK